MTRSHRGMTVAAGLAGLILLVGVVPALADEPSGCRFGGSTPTKDGRVALLIGINDYPGTRFDLKGTENDVELMRRLLVEQLAFAPEDVCELRDAEATRTNVIRGIREHLGRAGADGAVVLYYSGHGTQLTEGNVALTAERDPEPDGDDEALVLADGSVLVDDELASLRTALPAGRVVFVFDSCFSGASNLAAQQVTYAKGVKSGAIPYRLPETFETIPTPAVRNLSKDERVVGSSGVFLAASRGNELSWVRRGWSDLDDRPASYFTFLFAQELRKEGALREPLAQVVGRVSKATTSSVSNDLNRQQHPVSEGAAAASLAALLGKP